MQVLAICCLGLVIYSQTFHGEFLFDDVSFITNNDGVKNVSDVNAISRILSQPSRIVPLYTFALNYHFNRLDPFAYHVVNFSIHIITTFLVWWFVWMLVAPRKRTSEVRLHLRGAVTPTRCVYGYGARVAFFTALLFVSHPVQTQAVSYIAQRFASMATMFYVGALCLYIKGRQLRRSLRSVGVPTKTSGWSVLCFIGAVLFGLLGMFTKEIVITLPLMILLIEFLFFHRKKKINWIYVIFALMGCMIIPFVFSFNFASLLFGTKMSESHPGDVITFGKYLLTQLRVFVVFIKLLFVPIGQNVDYDFHLSKNIFEWPVILSFVFLEFIMFFGLRLAYLAGLFSKRPMGARRRLISTYALIAFGIFWVFLTFSPNLIPRRHVIFEHKLYLISIGFYIALSVGLCALIKNVRKLVLVMAVIILTCSFLSYQRNKIWQGPIPLWEDVIKKSPNKARAHINLGRAYIQRKQYDRAMQHLDKSLGINPLHSLGYNNKGIIYGTKHQYDLALKNFNQALQINPRFYEAYNNRGVVYRDNNHFEEALEDFSKALDLKPDFDKAYYNRGTVYKNKRQYESALADYNRTIELNHQYVSAYGDRGIIHLYQKQYDLAFKDFEKALSLRPDYVEVYVNRGILYGMKGRYDLAIQDFNQALKINKNYAKAYYNRHLIYLKIGEKQKALEDVQKARALGVDVSDEYLETIR